MKAASVDIEWGWGALSNCTVEIGRWGVKIDLAKYAFFPSQLTPTKSKPNIHPFVIAVKYPRIYDSNANG